MKRAAIASLLGAALLLHGCGSPSEGGRPSPSASPVGTKSSGKPGDPRIEILSPKPGEVIDDGEVEIRTAVHDFDLVDKIGGKNKEGQGHIIFYRLESDDAKIPTQKNLVAHVGGEGRFTSYAGAEKIYVWQDTPGRGIPPGTYTFAVQLVRNNQTPLTPPQVAEVTVEVR